MARAAAQMRAYTPSLTRGLRKGVAVEITVTGRNVDVSKSLHAAVEEKVGRLGRFLDGMERADVRFSEERNPRISEREVCEVTMQGHGHVVRAHAAASDTLAALDLVVDKLAHRLHKLKGKLVTRSHPRRHDGTVLDPTPEDDLDEDQGSPRIVKVKQFDIKPMTPEEAALQMELLGHDFFLFTNADTNAAGVVYRRQDGDIGLIEGA